MSTTLLRPALLRRLASGLTTALFGLTLALNPASAVTADAAIPAFVGVRVLQVARTFVGIPYTYGGASPRTGFDCSGLTMYSYARVGKRIPRTAQQQYRATIRIPWRAARPGDLVFFYSGRTISHVGIYAGNWYMYAAPHTGQRVKKQHIYTSKVVFGRVR